MLEIGELRLLTDPTFEPPRSYDTRGITLTKQAGPALPAADIGTVDAVLLSHDQHFDNLDHAGRALLPQAGRVLTIVPGAARLGDLAQGLAPWPEVFLADARGTQPAGHSDALKARPGWDRANQRRGDRVRDVMEGARHDGRGQPRLRSFCKLV